MKEIFAYLIPILAQIESGGDPNAIGDNGASVGILQISVAVVIDVNNLVRSTNYELNDRLDPLKSAEICEAYLNHYGKAICNSIMCTDSEKVRHLSRIWNGGPGGHLKQSTREYGTKAENLYRSIKNVQKLAELYQSLHVGYDHIDSPHPYDFGVQASVHSQRDRSSNIERDTQFSDRYCTKPVQESISDQREDNEHVEQERRLGGGGNSCDSDGC